MKNPRKLILIYLLNLSGGAGKSAVAYANIISKTGQDVCIVCGFVRDEFLRNFLLSSVKVIELRYARSLLIPLRLANLLWRISPDIVMVMGASNMLPVNISLHLLPLRSKVILREANSPSGLLESYPPLKRAVKRLLFNYAFQSADHLIAITHAMQEEFENEWNIPSDRISLIYNGVLLPDTMPSPSVRAKPPILLCVARLQPQKDISTLLQAFALLRDRCSCRLWLAGNGRERTRLEMLAKKLNIIDDIEFLGHVTDVKSLYQQATLTVLASRFEGFPNVLIEALSQGCPVVATDCPTGPAEIIGDTNVGLLAEVGNAEDLANKLETALGRSFDQSELFARAAMFSNSAMDKRIRELLRVTL